MPKVSTTETGLLKDAIGNPDWEKTKTKRNKNQVLMRLMASLATARAEAEIVAKADQKQVFQLHQIKWEQKLY